MRNHLTFIKTETLEKTPLPGLVLMHQKIHSTKPEVFKSMALDDAALLNLQLHQEFQRRGEKIEKAGESLDEVSAVYAVEVGMTDAELAAYNLPSLECDDIDVRVVVTKSDDDKRIVLGVAMEPDETDTHEETVSEDEIEREAHMWLAHRQTRGLMHTQIANQEFELYESYVTPADLTIDGQKVKKGSWLMMLHVVDDDIWKQIKNGELTGLSIGGWARKRKLGQENGETTEE